MLNTLWILAAANILYVLYRIISQRSKTEEQNSSADQISFLDVPDEVLNATPVMPKAVQLKDAPKNSAQWWDEKINLPRSGQSGSRRGKKIEHDQLLLSDLDSNL